MIGRFKCQMCKNFLSGNVMPDTWKCKAFPDGIPQKKIMFISRDDCINCNKGIGFEQEDDDEETFN